MAAFNKKIYKLLLVFAVVLCGSAIAGAGVIYWLLQSNPRDIASGFFNKLIKDYGITVNFESVDLDILPLPSIAVSDISVEGNDFKFKAAWLSLRPSFTALLTGKFEPAHISLLRPALLISPGKPLAELGKIVRQEDQKSSDSRFLPDSCGLEIKQGKIKVVGSDGRFALNGLECQLDLRNKGKSDGRIRINNFYYAKGEKPIFRLAKLRIAGKCDIFNILEDTSSLNINGLFQMPDVVYSALFEVKFNGSISGWTASSHIDCDLNLNNNHVPASLTGRATKLIDSDEIALSSVEWQMDADSGGLDAILTLPPKPSDFSLAGNFTARRVSLTQWLGFARNLAPGLQLALDNVFKVKIKFSISAKQLMASSISAVCNGSTFTGTGSVADFTKPVVYLDLKTDKTNLGLAIPESVFKSPMPPFFPYPTLTPMPGEPLQPGETGVGYDIRLAAQTLLYGPLKMSNSSLRIYPGKLDKSGLEDVLLTAKSDFYKGKLKGECILGADPSMPCNINVSVSQANGKLVAAAMSSLPIKQGEFNAKINVFSKGKTLNVFLANLHGTLNVSGKKAMLKATGNEQLSTLETSLNLKSAALEKNGASFTGQWKADANFADLSLKSTLDGKLSFDKNGIALKDSPAKIDINFNKDFGPLPKKTALHVEGIATFLSDKARLSLAKMRAELMGTKLEGDLTVNASKKDWQGTMTVNIDNLEKVAQKMAFSGFKIPAAFRKIKLQTSFTGNPDNLALNNLKGSFGTNSFSGSLKWQNKAIPFFETTLNLDNLDLDSLVKDQSSQKKANKWDYPFLTKFDLTGKFLIKNLHISKLPLKNMSTSLKLEKGKLTVSQMKAAFYNTSIQGSLKADFNRGLKFNGNVSSHGFNLETVAAAYKIKPQLKGNASIDCSGRATLDGSKDLLPNLNGDWNFNVYSGSWQERSANGSLKGKATTFTRASASGKITNGKLESRDFTLLANNLNVTGGGWLNLVTDQIDCNFNVNMRGLPEFPLRLYGALNNVQTSIGAGKMVVNALGDITSGVLGIVGGVFNGVFQIFNPKTYMTKRK